MLSGKVVVVTGASSGIGAALVEKLTNRGALVVGLARRIDKMENVVASLPANTFHPRYCDMTKEADIVDGVAWAVTKFGTIDILINNAGVCEIASLIDGDTKKWKRMFDVNVMGLCIATREALRIMRLNGSGYILNINSVAGHAVPHFKNIPVGVYSATKHALTALTEALRYELQDAESDIRVSCISPGSVYTELHSKLNGEKDVPDVPSNSEVPEGFLNAEDIANSIISILTTPRHIATHDVHIQSVKPFEL